MKMKFYTIAMLNVYLFCLVIMSCDKSENRATVGNGGTISQIVIPSEENKTAKFAAEELQEYLQKITGIELPVSTGGNGESIKNAIRLRLIDDENIRWDGFRIEPENNGLLISANEPRGLLFGAYQLLEEAGCSFVYLDQSEEIVPLENLIELTTNERVFTPAVEHRGMAPYGLQSSSTEMGRDFISWMAKNKLNFILVSEDRPSDVMGPSHGSLWKEVEDQLLPELQKRDFIIDMSEHCTHIFFPPSLFEKHPEWFALNDGERKLHQPHNSAQMCYANDEGVEYYANAVAEYAAEHPEFHLIGTWPLDGGNYCECEGCKDPLTIFNAAKKVAQEVQKVRPDMIVEHLAYKPQTWQPPDEEVPANMSILWCPDNGELDDLAKQWVKNSKDAGGVYQFEYYMGDNYRTTANVWLRPEFSANLVSEAQEIGYRGIVSLFLPMQNWWRACFNSWFFAKACWEPQMDIDATLNQYTQDYYGKYAPEIEAILKTLFSEVHPEPFIQLNKLHEKSENSVSVKISDEVIIEKTAKLTSKLNDLLAEREMNEKLRQRIERLKIYVEYFGEYARAFSGRAPEDLDRLVNYAELHREHEEVLMYPEYIQQRNRRFFK